MKEGAGIGEIAELHADARKDRDRAEDFRDDHEWYEIRRLVSEVPQSPPNPVTLGDVHIGRSQVEQRQKHRANPICVIFKHDPILVAGLQKHARYRDCWLVSGAFLMNALAHGPKMSSKI